MAVAVEVGVGAEVGVEVESGLTVRQGTSTMNWCSAREKNQTRRSQRWLVHQTTSPCSAGESICSSVRLAA